LVCGVLAAAVGWALVPRDPEMVALSDSSSMLLTAARETDLLTKARQISQAIERSQPYREKPAFASLASQAENELTKVFDDVERESKNQLAAAEKQPDETRQREKLRDVVRFTGGFVTQFPEVEAVEPVNLVYKTAQQRLYQLV